MYTKSNNGSPDFIVHLRAFHLASFVDYISSLKYNKISLIFTTCKIS